MKITVPNTSLMSTDANSHDKAGKLHWHNSRKDVSNRAKYNEHT